MKRLLSAAVVATLGAGAVAVWRQRQEAVRARAAGTPPRRPAGTEDGEHLDVTGRALAEWVPTRPTTRAGRVAAAVWASPLTLVGLVFGVLSGGTPRWDPGHGCVVFERSGGVSGWILERIGARANAIGQVVVVRGGDGGTALLAHEAVHVRQAERLGPLLFPLYVWLGARYGYADHPLERAARRGARADDRKVS